MTVKGGSLSEETKRKISETLKGRPNCMKGKKHSEEAKKNIREGAKGRLKPSPLKGRCLSEETKKKISKTLKGKPLSEETKKKMSTSMKGKNRGKTLSEETKKKISKTLSAGSSFWWKGGYCSKNIPLYDTYAHQLEPYEECRRNEEDLNILEVKCAYCGKWFVPNWSGVVARIKGINGNDLLRLYCSDTCKKECPTYNQRKHYKGQENTNSREVQPQLRQLVFERDNWTCQKCGSQCSLHCHHIDPVKSNPIESADVDNCTTLCKNCHKWVHKNIPGCGYRELVDC